MRKNIWHCHASNKPEAGAAPIAISALAGEKPVAAYAYGGPHGLWKADMTRGAFTELAKAPAGTGRGLWFVTKSR